MFDEDLTSLYPSIIMTLNIGKETLIGRIIPEDDRDCRLGFDNLKSMDQNIQLTIESPNRKRKQIKVKDLLNVIESKNLSISANGTFFRQDTESVLSTILSKWFDERKEYKNKMKKAYTSGNEAEGEYYYLMQYTFKILLNSLYGALALPSFRYGSVILNEAITLSGQRIIQESSLCANNYANKL